jgi:hypothetical protein
LYLKQELSMSRTETVVAAELRQLGCVPDRHEIAALSHTLDKEEAITNALYGAEKRGFWNTFLMSDVSKWNTLVALTDQRILLVRSRRGGDVRRGQVRVTCHYSFWKESYSVADKSLDFYGSFWGVIHINGENQLDIKFPIGAVDHERYRAFYSSIEERLLPHRKGAASRTPDSSAAQSGGVSAQSGGVSAEIDRLAAQRQQGLLTEEEFQAAKRQVLGLDPESGQRDPFKRKTLDEFLAIHGPVSVNRPLRYSGKTIGFYIEPRLGMGPNEFVDEGDLVLIRAWEPAQVTTSSGALQSTPLFPVQLRSQTTSTWVDGFFEIEEFTEFCEGLSPVGEDTQSGT